jgi:hypothetical protein
VVQAQGVGKRKTYAGSWVEALNKAGYSCAGIDNRGCGRSGGLFGYVNDHTDWVNDLVSCLSSCSLSKGSWVGWWWVGGWGDLRLSTHSRQSEVAELVNLQLPCAFVGLMRARASARMQLQ